MNENTDKTPLTNKEFAKNVQKIGESSSTPCPGGAAYYDPDGACVEFLLTPDTFYGDYIDRLRRKNGRSKTVESACAEFWRTNHRTRCGPEQQGKDNVMATDIDHLHDVMMGRVTGRGCGKTYACCHLVCGFFALGFGLDEDLCVFLSTERDEYPFLHTLMEVASEYGMLVRPTPHGCLINDCFVLRFLVPGIPDTGHPSGQVVDARRYSSPDIYSYEWYSEDRESTGFSVALDEYMIRPPTPPSPAPPAEPPGT